MTYVRMDLNMNLEITDAKSVYNLSTINVYTNAGESIAPEGSLSRYLHKLYTLKEGSFKPASLSNIKRYP